MFRIKLLLAITLFISLPCCKDSERKKRETHAAMVDFAAPLSLGVFRIYKNKPIKFEDIQECAFGLLKSTDPLLIKKAIVTDVLVCGDSIKWVAFFDKKPGVLIPVIVKQSDGSYLAIDNNNDLVYLDELDIQKMGAQYFSVGSALKHERGRGR